MKENTNIITIIIGIEYHANLVTMLSFSDRKLKRENDLEEEQRIYCHLTVKHMQDFGKYEAQWLNQKQETEYSLNSFNSVPSWYGVKRIKSIFADKGNSGTMFGVPLYFLK